MGEGEDGSAGRLGGREQWRVDRALEDDHLGTLWIRWTDGGTDLHLHRVCDLLPRVRLTGTPPFVSVRPEDGERPTFVPVRGDEEATEPVQFRFLTGLPRQLLRHVPLVIVTALIVLLVGAEFTPGVDGLTVLVPSLRGENVLLFGLFLLITPLMLWLFSAVDVLEPREVLPAAATYGLLAVLAGGVGVSVLLTVIADHPSETPPSVVFVSGYLLTLLVGGQLLYEAILRIEHLFVKLGRRTGDIVDDERAYRRFLTDLHDGLGASAFGLGPSRLFGVLFAAQFAMIWIIGGGARELGFGVGLAVNFALDAVLATIFFQFLVLIRYFNRLLNATGEYADVGITYQPFHVDGHGGFRDLGQFAMRINVIFILGGLYLVYRLYIIGGRALPVEGLAGFADPVLLSIWVISFVGPVAAYALGVVAWGYYSFWTMHAKMVRDKHALARRYQGNGSRPDVDRTPAAGDGMETFDASEGPAWSALNAAPTWPVDVTRLKSLITGNALPLLVPASNLLF
jgi:hypothetical protein